ncbi:hypothetical protein [Flavobacterium taihuense]|uniref:Uncharacterized protein n=1 Tax=Flavobacterium taihuense TaxID=2857508 RepID=A0ABS6Y3Q8_9FLAO|nr:hypothetical protein [Flavobacterium taihuense]MBW4362719.1 hypothetical protein [Flavobacterium taihuense]
MKNTTLIIILISLITFKSNAQENYSAEDTYLEMINPDAKDSLFVKMENELNNIQKFDKYLEGDGGDKWINDAGSKAMDSIKKRYQTIAESIFTVEVESNNYKTAINPYNQTDNIILFTKDYGRVRITFGSNKSFITCQGMKNHPYEANLGNGYKYNIINFKLEKDVIVVKTKDLLQKDFTDLHLKSNKGSISYELNSDHNEFRIIEDLVEYFNPEINKLLKNKNAVFELNRSNALKFTRDGELNSIINMSTNDGSNRTFTMDTNGKLYSKKDKAGNIIVLDIIKYENNQLTFKYIDKTNKINKTLTLSNIIN